MKKLALTFYLGVSLIWGQAASPTSVHNRQAFSLQSARTVLDQYCVACHNQKAKVGGLALDKLDLAHIADNAEIWEKVVRKLSAGMMPPSGSKRPDPEIYKLLRGTLEAELDRSALTKPNMAAPGIHRMNRVEYANAVYDLLGLDVDPAEYLPVDDSSYGFGLLSEKCN